MASTATKTVAETAPLVAAGDFAITTADADLINSLREVRRETKYPKLLDAFLANTKTGEAMEIKNSDGSPLSEDEVNRMYGGINNYKRYRKTNNDETIPVAVRKAGNRLFITNEKEG
jgi:hypothetical protein